MIIYKKKGNRLLTVLKEFWYIFIFLAFIIVITIIIVRYRIKQIVKREKEKSELITKMFELEIKVVKAQINPHFISNCLAAIQELIYSNDIEKAGQYIAKFSFFMRQVLNYSDKTFITLKEEIDIISLNIELEQLRFKDNFEFDVNIENGILTDAIQIPSLITQPFIENAIWHGLLPLKDSRKAKLSLNVFLKEKIIYIEIVDNGVGRKPQNADSTRISKGTKFGIDKIENINKLFSNQYRLEIVDLFDEKKNPCGTKVIIQLINYSDEL